jgi:hypothetical protein
MILSINALAFILIIETGLISMVLAVFFIYRNRYHRGLYAKTVKELEDAEQELLELKKNQAASHFEPPAPLNPVEEMPKFEIEPEPAPEPEAAIEPEAPIQPEVKAQSAEEPPAEVIPSGATIAKLLHMVKFNKNTILELMCFKDILGQAQGRLDVFSKGMQEISASLQWALEAGDSEEAKSSLKSIEKTSQDMAACTEVVGREDVSLTGKFGRWEEEFKRLWAELEDISATAEDVKDVDVSGQEDLLQRNSELEARLAEKAKEIDEMQITYNDLEKEYMILYRAQQAAKQSANPG